MIITLWRGDARLPKLNTMPAIVAFPDTYVYAYIYIYIPYDELSINLLLSEVIWLF